jgi:phosphate uptake regulator
MFNKLFGFSRSSSLVDAAMKDISRMLQQAGKMLDHSLANLLDNQTLEVDLESMDDVIDEAEQSVRRSILEHLVVSPRKDLSISLILASIVQDAERIGDFARGLAQVATLAKGPREGPFADRLRSLAMRVRPLFEQCEQAFREDDVDLARALVINHRALKAELIQYVQDLANSDLSPDMALAYGTSATMLRRISSHLSNIVSTVIQPFDRIRHGDEEA